MSLLAARAQFHYRVANLFLRLRCYEAAANAYERILCIRPDDPTIQFQRAWCLLEVPDRRLDAIVGFQKLLRESPSAEGYFLLACGLQMESRHEEAVQVFREAVRLEGSGTVDLYHNYAVSLETLRRFEEAAEAYETLRISVRPRRRIGETWERCSLNWGGGKMRRLARNAPCDWPRA